MPSAVPNLDALIARAKELELNATAIYLRMAKSAASTIAQKEAMNQAARSAIEYGRQPETDKISNQTFTSFMWNLEKCRRALQQAAMERVKRSR